MRQPGTQTVALPAGQGASRDFGNSRVVDAGADRKSVEGVSVINFTGLVHDPNPANGSSFSFLWQVAADNGHVIPDGATQNFSFTPIDDGRYAVTFTVTDLNDGNRPYVDTVFVFAGNVAPSFEAGLDTTLNEGDTFNRELTFTDPGADVWTGTVDFGDGSGIVELTSAELSDKAFTLSHVYTDSGLFSVVVTLQDDDGGTISDGLQVISNNLPPTADAGLDQTVPEGALTTLAAVVTDPGAGDTHSYQWSVEASNGQVVPVGTSQTFTFIPSDQGTYAVTVTVTDDDGASAADSVSITVVDVPPTLVLNGATGVNEGTPYLLTLGPVSDPGSETVTQYVIHWGDGVTDTLSAAAVTAANRQINHTYASGTISRTIAIDLVDEDGTHVNAGTKDVTVQNVSAVLTGVTPNATKLQENGILTLTGTFTDPGTQDNHTVKILWGDGSPEQIVVLATGARDFTAIHQYLDDDPSGTASDVYPIAILVNDGAADSGAGTTRVTVTNSAPTFSAFTQSSATVTEGASLSLDGTLSDIGSLDTHTVTVNWGDGSTLETLSLSPTGTFTGSHLYTVPGSYGIVTTAADDDGGLVQDTRFVVIADLAPVISPADLGTTPEGTLFTTTGSFSDPSGPEDNWTATVQYDSGPVLPLALNPEQTFSLQHIFANNSPHTATVTVTDRFGQRDVETFAVDVQNVAPAVSSVPDLTLQLGTALVREITFTDPGSDIWTATIDYGDGSAPQTLQNLTQRSFTLTHAYTQPGVFPVTVSGDRPGPRGRDGPIPRERRSGAGATTRRRGFSTDGSGIYGHPQPALRWQPPQPVQHGDGWLRAG